MKEYKLDYVKRIEFYTNSKVGCIEVTTDFKNVQNLDIGECYLSFDADGVHFGHKVLISEIHKQFSDSSIYFTRHIKAYQNLFLLKEVL